MATVVLMAYTQTVASLADVAREPGVELGELRSPTFVLHSGGAALLLIAATVLAVYKSRGLTRYGRRRQRRRAPD